MAESKSAPKVFDVAKPGKSAPSASAKPILITNRPVLKDPMVNDPDDAKPAETAKAEKVSATSHVKIEPIHIKSESDASDPKPSKAAAPDEPAEPPAADEPKAAEKPEPAAETDPPAAEPESTADAAAPEPPTDDTATESTPAAAPDQPDADDQPGETSRDELKDVKQGDGTDNADEIAAQKEQERAEELQKLALSRKYYLPINQVEHRRNRRATWVGIAVIVLLCLAWADVALDAGLITIPGVKAPIKIINK